MFGWDPPTPGGREDLSGWRRKLSVWASVLVATGFTVVGTILAVFLVPLYAGAVRLPVCLLVTVLVNATAVWFVIRMTGRRLAALGPILGWFVVVFTLGMPTTEGDVVLPSDWVGLALPFLGALTLMVATFASGDKDRTVNRGMELR